jgi:hypothetical protein
MKNPIYPFPRLVMQWATMVTMLFCSLTIIFANSAFAQFLDQGAITGTVQDNTGAAIPGATVIIENPETGFKLTSTADKSGVYVFSPIKIGTYTVTSTAPGFEKAVQKNIKISLGERVNFSPKLKLGSVSETVTVTTAPPLLQSQDSSVGQIMTSQQINDTPLNGRNVIYLAQLTAGTTPAKSRANGTGDFDANGLRAEQNNFVLDGVDNNSVTQDYLGNTSYLINPPPDALAEFKVTTSNYSAEYGHSAGAVVNASIKAGTNHIHGDLWEYWRNDILDTHDWVTPTLPNSEYRQNLFGATLGLPIIKNHLFFFGDLQANRIVIDQGQAPAAVPTLLERTGDFSELLNKTLTGGSVPVQLYQPQNNQVTQTCPARATASDTTGNNILCYNQIDSLAQKVLNMYPLPNAGVAGQTYQNYAYNLKQPQNTFQWDARADWDINPKDQMFARFSYNNTIGNFQAPLGPVLDGGGGEGSTDVSGVQVNYGNNFVLSETHVFTPRLVNEFRFAFDFGHFDTLNPGYNVDNATALGFGGIPFGAGFPDNGGLPTTTVSSIASFGAHAYRPEEEFEDEYQILDNVSWSLGNHSITMGFSLQSIRSQTLEPPASHPQYTFSGAQTAKPSTSNTGNGVADFLLDEMSGGSIGPSGAFNDAQNNISGYLQDDWKVTKSLTLNLGVRYDYFQPYKEMAGRQANFYVTSAGVSTGTGVYLLPAEDQGKVTLNPDFLALLTKDNITLKYDSNPRLTQQQNLNFAPRIGFAYTTDPKTVIRGGFGLFYQGQQEAGAADNIGTNYPFVFTDNFPAAGCTAGSASCPNNGINLETGFSNLLSAGLNTAFSTPTLIGQSPNLKTTYAMDYNLAFEEAITNNMVATISYVGTASRHLPIGINTNSTVALLPSSTTQLFLPFPDFTGSTDVLYEGISEYNSLQAKLQKRISHNLDFLATYTWSHSMDDAAEPLGGGIGGYRDASIVPIRDDMTNSGWDVRHRATFNGFYKLPFGRGEAHLSNDSRLVDTFLGGWALNATFQIQSGQPFSVSTANTTGATGGSHYPIQVGNPYAPGGSPNPTNTSITCPTSVRNKTNWFNPCAFANPALAKLITPFKPNTPTGQTPVSICPDPTIACMPALYPYPTYIEDEATAKLFLGGVSDTLYGPGFQRLDASIFKHFLTYKAQYVEFRADVFNLTNSELWGQPNGTIGQKGGNITGARQTQNDTPDGRFFQLSAKYVF